MKKLLFLYSLEDEYLWKDGLYAAVEELKKHFEVTKYNEKNPINAALSTDGYDFYLGWGGFGSPIDQTLHALKWANPNAKIGLCLGGYAPITDTKPYDVIFYETEWSKKWLEEQGVTTKLVHAFGVNTAIYYEMGEDECPEIWDYITVGAFATWKRQHLINSKFGTKMAVGQIQKENLHESVNIIGDLLLGHCGVSDMVPPETLARMYNASKTCYIPADVMGGGERAVLEARACGIKVEVEPDNPKLLELITSPVWDDKYYAKKLKEGILQCIS